MKFSQLVCVIVLSVVSGWGIAGTYYVDLRVGNDSWSGKASAPAGSPPTDGPWKTLSRVKAAALLPGDSVLLRCGLVWREPLVVPASGTSGNPITISTFPADCPTRPVIDGSIDVPSGNWLLNGGRTYRARLPLDAMINGTFSTGLAGWRIWSPHGDGSIADEAACADAVGGCLTLKAGSGNVYSLVSSPRFLLQSIDYKALVSVRAPFGTPIQIAVRRDGGSFEVMGLLQTVIATGIWQRFSIPFKGAGDIANARFDIGVPPGVIASIDNVRLEITNITPQQLFVRGRRMTPARYPNRGHDPDRSQSPYLISPVASDQIVVNGRPGSTYLTMGDDLKLKPGVSITPGLAIRIRTHGWLVDERVVSSVSGKRVYLDKPTSYPLEPSKGYFFMGAAWMLDEADEWQYDAPSNVIYAWMPDGGVPGPRVGLGRMDVGIDAANRSFVVIDGIAVRRTGVGVDLQRTTAVTYRNGTVSDTLNEGLDASGSINDVVENSTFYLTGRDAISGVSPTTGRIATGFRVTGNDVTESGVRIENGVVTSIPVWSFAAIRTGNTSVVSDNRVVNAGYFGIWPLKNSSVTNNYIESSCLVLDDCGAIYVSLPQNNSVVTGNLIYHSVGSIDGKDLDYSQAQGIYLDDSVSGVTVSANTVVDADNGIQLHNASSNDIFNNKFFGNRRYQAWLQEGSKKIRASGDIFGNRFRGNTFVPINGNPSVYHQTLFKSTSAFASYDTNRYSSLSSSTVALETWDQASANYSFPEWKTATTPDGIPRLIEPNGAQVTLGANARFRISGPSILPNSAPDAGVLGWTSWNQKAPFGSLVAMKCSAGPCLKYTGGGSLGLISTPNFSVVKDQWYRITLDMQTGADLQPLVVGIRRGGGGALNNYDWLMKAPPTLMGSKVWKRYSFPVLVLETVNANDPVTEDKGARVDVQVNNPGQQVWIANVEIVPMAPVGAALRTNIVMNPSRSPMSVACPDADTEPVFCGRYLRLTDGVPVSWPYALPPLGSEIIYSRGDTLVDADQDGIGDAQDVCPGSPIGGAVNASGCALGQVPP